MSDIQTYPTRQAAQAEADGFVGWGKIKVVKVETDSKPVYAIEVNGDKYYRTDGQVR